MINNEKSSNPQYKAITIIDSSDEEEAELLVVTDASVQAPDNLHKRRCLKEEQVSKKVKLSINACHQLFCFPITSLMFGQYSANRVGSLKLSNAGLSIEVSDTVLQLKWIDLKLIEISPNGSEPCLFVTLRKNRLKSIHLQLGLTPGKFPCYNPNGSDDQKYIIFYINKIWHWKNSSCLQEKLLDFPHRGQSEVSILTISADASNRRQFEAAEAGMFRSKGNIFARKSPKQKRASTYSKSRPFVKESEEWNDHRTTLAVYPPPPSPGGIAITNKDAACLNHGEFLNDVIIDFYLQYVVHEILSEEDRRRCHVFSSFFFKRLSQPLNDESHKFGLSASERRYARVQKWSGSVDIFSKDFLFIPVNESAHWYLAVVCFPGEVKNTATDLLIVRSEEKSVEVDSQSCARSISDVAPFPCILILDSMWRTERADISPVFRQYLNEEWRNRKADKRSKGIYNRQSMKCIRPRVPQQDNNYDCGLFLLHFVEKMFELPIQHFPSHIRSLGSWFPSLEVKLKRPKVKRLISKLHRKQSSIS